MTISKIIKKNKVNKHKKSFTISNNTKDFVSNIKSLYKQKSKLDMNYKLFLIPNDITNFISNLKSIYKQKSYDETKINIINNSNKQITLIPFEKTLSLNHQKKITEKLILYPNQFVSITSNDIDWLVTISYDLDQNIPIGEINSISSFYVKNFNTSINSPYKIIHDKLLRYIKIIN